MPPKPSTTKIGKNAKKKKEKVPKDVAKNSLLGDSNTSADAIDKLNTGNPGEKEKTGKKKLKSSGQNAPINLSAPSSVIPTLNDSLIDPPGHSSMPLTAVKSASIGVKASKSQSPNDEKFTEKNVQEKSLKFCNGLVQKLLGKAFNICAERFLQGNAPLVVSLELRDTWLRIIEMEWLDQDQPREDVTSEMFLADEPPYPLAFDSWSRGAIEILPNARRESVMDPFLRDIIPQDKSGGGDQTPRMRMSTMSTMEELMFKPRRVEIVSKEKYGLTKKKPNQNLKSNKKEPRPKPMETEKTKVKKSPAEKIVMKKTEKEKIKGKLKRKDSEGRKKKRVLIVPGPPSRPGSRPKSIKMKDPSAASAQPTTLTPSKLETYLTSGDVCEDDEELEGEYLEDTIFVPELPYRCAVPTQKLPIKPDYDLEEILFPPKNMLSDQMSPSLSQEYVPYGLHPWSPSQCGGPTRSGVYKLPTERSSEALRNAQKIRKEKHDQDIMEYAKEEEIQAETIFFNEMENFFEDENLDEDIDHFGVDSRGYEAEYEGESDYTTATQRKQRRQSVQSQHLASQIMETPLPPPRPHVNVVARIDNLDHADSDEVVHILAPHEAPIKSDRERDRHHVKRLSFSMNEKKSKLFSHSVKKSVNVNDHETNAGHTRKAGTNGTAGVMTSERFQIDKNTKNISKKKEADVNVNESTTQPQPPIGKKKSSKVILTINEHEKIEEKEKRKDSILDMKDEVIKKQRNSIKARLQKPGIKFNGI